MPRNAAAALGAASTAARTTFVVFEGGRIVQRGTYEELLGAEGLFRTLALRQLA
jgi:ABC-type multidrug transport system fused ATPase/permease subunit